ncbi:hypothetical protein FW754_15380 [Acinetobacter sp. 1207_04]|uniref:hypothetical protein n=1 Tax=Acinetobacter sp. 1207_04 TaxID=2604449 RepID=UPI0040589C7D
MIDHNEKQSDDQQNISATYNPNTHYPLKKMTYWNFVLFEFLVFICISSVTFFGTYIGTNRFESENLFVNNIKVYTEFFNIGNIGNTILGVFIIIGFLTTLNMMATNFEQNLDSLLKRLIFSGIDFIYLMISTMLGFSVATYVFALNQPLNQDIIDLKHTLIKLIILLSGLAIVYIPTCMVLPHREKISDLKKKK